MENNTVTISAGWHEELCKGFGEGQDSVTGSFRGKRSGCRVAAYYLRDAGSESYG